MLFCMMLLGLFTAPAQPPMPKIINGSVCWMSSSRDITYKTVETKPQTGKTPSLAAKPKAGAATYQVDFVLDFDEENQIATQIFLRNSEYMMPCSGLVKGSNVLAVPAGTYDIIVEFQELDMTQEEAIPQKLMLVFRELVDINHDMTVDISADEAKNHVHFETLNMEGEPFDPDKYDIDKNGEWILSKEGNCDQILFDNRIYCEDYGSLFVFTDLIGLNDHFYDATARMFAEFYVNDLSSRWALYSYRAVIKGREVYTSALEAQGVTANVTLANDPSKYQLFEDPFLVPEFLVIGEDMYQTIHMYPRIDKDWYVIGSLYSFGTPIVEGETCKYYISASVEASQIAGYIPVLEPKACLRFVDEDGWTVYYPALQSNPITMSCDQAIFANNGIGDGGSYVYTMFGYLFSEELNEIYVYPYWPTHPVFSYSVEKKKDLLGNNCPIFVANLSQLKLSEDSYYMGYEFGYVGRYGESRPNAVGETDINIKLNGEEIISYQGPFGTEISPLPYGEIDATINNETFSVDDMTASNKAQLHYTIGAEDETPPTVTMLDFKASNGDVTDRFATADEGTLEFSAGDFNFIISPGGYQGYNALALESVEVSYSPYCEDNWDELAVEEEPENYWPVMGWFYTGSLAGVTGQGLNGWFDLKIRLTDAAGNWQEQVISPAFRLDDHAFSSVATLHDNNAHEVARYNLAGQRVNSDATGVVIIKMSDGTARKVIL